VSDGIRQGLKEMMCTTFVDPIANFIQPLGLLT
jgi:hypothetical protein